MIAYAEYHRWSEILNEGMYQNFVQGVKSGYSSAKDETQQQFEKYGPVAKQALSKASGLAASYSRKLGIPPELATALIASGMVGGPTAVPFAALMYFVKKPVNKVANAAFNTAWDTGAKAVNAVKNMGGNPALQPESFSFSQWLLMVEQESLMNRMASGAGRMVGRFAGNLSGVAGKVGQTMKNSVGEIYKYVSKNPKEVARALFLVGVGAATGAAVGNITHNVKDMLVQKIQDVAQGVPAEEVAWLRKNIVFEPGEDGNFTATNQMLQQGNKNYMDVPMDPPDGESIGIFGGDSINTTFDPTAVLDKTSMLNVVGSSHSGGKMGAFDGTINSPNLDQAYRDAAKQMGGNLSSQSSTGPWAPMLGKTTGIMPNLRDLNVNPEDMVAQYGRSAADEISSRLATPNTYTNPAAIAGGVAGGVPNAPSGPKAPRRRYDLSSQAYMNNFPR
jgi:hypothetical protein